MFLPLQHHPMKESVRYAHICATYHGNNSMIQISFPVSEEGVSVERTIAARQAKLATLPLPSGIPDDALQPIMIHPPHTLQEFLANASGVGLFRDTLMMLTSSSLSRICEDSLLTLSEDSPWFPNGYHRNQPIRDLVDLKIAESFLSRQRTGVRTGKSTGISSLRYSSAAQIRALRPHTAGLVLT